MQRIFGFQKFEVRSGSFSGRDTEMCEQLRKRKVDMCCQQKEDGESKKLDLLVSEVRDISCGALEIMME